MSDELKAANELDYVKMIINGARVSADTGDQESIEAARTRMHQIAKANPQYAKGTNDDGQKTSIPLFLHGQG